MSDLQRIDARILDQYDELTPQQRRLAEVILQHRNEFGNFSAAELAREANVSKATAVRLFQRLGYERFEDARYLAAKEPWGSPLRGLDQETPSEVDAFEKHLAREMDNLRRSSASLDRSTIEQAITLLGSGRTVWVMGLRISYSIARYLTSILSNVRHQVRSLPDGGMEFAEGFAGIGPDDVIVIVAFRRRPPVIARIIKTLSEKSVPIILMSDLSLVRPAGDNIVHLRCHSHGTSIFDSHVTAFSLVNFLCSQVGIRDRKSADGYISRIEKLHEALDDITST
ncbi:MurR/RpiR family transcriptional regulator [Mesorhizobium sp. A623]